MSKTRRIEGVDNTNVTGLYPKAAGDITSVTSVVARPVSTVDLNKSDTVEFHIRSRPNTRIR